MELDFGFTPGEVDLDEDGSVILGPGIKDHLGVRHAIRQNIVRQNGVRAIAGKFQRAISAPSKSGTHRSGERSRPDFNGPVAVPKLPVPQAPRRRRTREEQRSIWRSKESPQEKRRRGARSESLLEYGDDDATIDYRTPDSQATQDYGSPRSRGSPRRAQSSGQRRWTDDLQRERENIPLLVPQERPFIRPPSRYVPFQRTPDAEESVSSSHSDNKHYFTKRFDDCKSELDDALVHDGWYLSKPATKGFLQFSSGKIPRDLTWEEIIADPLPITAGKLKEIQGLYDFGCFERCPWARCRNIIDARPVATWKMVDGVLSIKCRLAARGFNDKMQQLEKYAGTTLRSGQRLVNVVVALFSLDVPQAFAKGMTFKGIAALTGTALREVQFDIPRADLDMIKPIYGFKDAPRAWRKKMHQVFAAWLSCRQLYAEPEPHCANGRKLSEVVTIQYERAKAHDAEQSEQGGKRTLEPLRLAELLCFLPVHVDDFKGAATRATADPLLKHLEREDWKVHGGVR